MAATSSPIGAFKRERLDALAARFREEEAAATLTAAAGGAGVSAPI